MTPMDMRFMAIIDKKSVFFFLLESELPSYYKKIYKHSVLYCL